MRQLTEGIYTEGVSASTRSRSSLPALKCGAYLADHHDTLTRLWIASFTWRTVVNTETAEAAYLDPITVGEVAGYFIKNCTNRKIDIVGRELGELGGKLLDKFGACHSK